MRRIFFACVALVSTGCAGILGLDEFGDGEGASGPGAGGAAGSTTTASGDPASTTTTGSAGDGGSGAGTGDGAGGSGGGGGETTGPLEVTPGEDVEVGVLHALQFEANHGVTWAVDEADGGRIDEEGLYVAPAEPGTFHVTATSTDDPDDSVTVAVLVAPLGVRIVTGQPGGPGTLDGPPNRSRVDDVAGMVALDDGRKVVFTDSNAHTVRILDDDQIVTTVAGLPYSPGAVDGSGDVARFNRPGAVAADRSSGIAYIVDRGNSCIRRLNTANGNVTTFAGECGAPGHLDATIGANARFDEITSLVMGPSGDRLYACDVGDTPSIRVISVATGATTSWLPDMLGYPYFSYDCHLSANYYDYVFVHAGYDLPVKRFRDQPQFDSTYLMQIAQLPPGTYFNAMTADTGWSENAIYGSRGSAIFRLDLDNPAEGFIRFLGAADDYTYVDGTFDDVRLFGAPAMAANGGYSEFYFADDADTIRVIDRNDEVVRTVAGKPLNFENVDGPKDVARIRSPFSLELDDDGNMYIASGGDDGGSGAIRKIDATGAISTFSGAPFEGEVVDGPADQATFGFIVDSVRVGDTLYVADLAAHTVRGVSLVDGSVTTIAGQSGMQGFQDGFAEDALFNFGQGAGLATDGTDLFVADALNFAVRRIDLATTEVTTIAGGTEGTSNGAGGEAQFMLPAGLAYEDGILYIADYADHVIRRLDLATAEVTTLIGQSGVVGTVDGGVGSATLAQPFRLVADGLGNLFVTSLPFEGEEALLVRRVDLQDVELSTLAGSRTGRGFATGPLPSSVGCPMTLRIDAAGDLVFGDYCDGVIGALRPL